MAIPCFRDVLGVVKKPCRCDLEAAGTIGYTCGMKLLLVMVLACDACAPTGPEKPTTNEEISESIRRDFFSAFARNDVTAIRNFAREPLEYAGMWFSSAACQREFPVARRIGADKLADFAACLATLPLVPSTRDDALYGVEVATYDPGIEIEIGFDYLHPDQGATIAWIGFAGRQGRADGIPAVTPDALASRVIAGDLELTTMPEAKVALDAEMATMRQPFLYTWFKICVDAEGSVTSVRARDTVSPLLVSTYKPIIEGWRFQPFKLGSQAVPVCTQQRFVYPRDAQPKHEELPLPDFSDAKDNILHVNHEVMTRIFGVTRIQPDDRDKTVIGKSKVDAIEVVVEYCIDEQGSVGKEFLVEPSGLPSYDAKVIAYVKQWKFKPFLIAGVPSRVCSGLKIHYTQH